mgnify:CR=1 FL=1
MTLKHSKYIIEARLYVVEEEMANNKNNGINKNVLILVIALFIIGIIFIINNIGNSKYNYSIETILNIMYMKLMDYLELLTKMEII